MITNTVTCHHYACKCARVVALNALADMAPTVAEAIQIDLQTLAVWDSDAPVPCRKTVTDQQDTTASK